MIFVVSLCSRARSLHVSPSAIVARRVVCLPSSALGYSRGAASTRCRGGNAVRRRVRRGQQSVEVDVWLPRRRFVHHQHDWNHGSRFNPDARADRNLLFAPRERHLPQKAGRIHSRADRAKGDAFVLRRRRIFRSSGRTEGARRDRKERVCGPATSEARNRPRLD